MIRTCIRLVLHVAALVGALSDAAEQGQNGVSDTTQDGDDEGAARIVQDPGVVVFRERAIQDLV
jgi:hypothetical protein